MRSGFRIYYYDGYKIDLRVPKDLHETVEYYNYIEQKIKHINDLYNDPES